MYKAVQSNKMEGTFLKKDDPKVAALMQQAELLSSLAQKVNAENTDQSLENAWKVRNHNLFHFPIIKILRNFPRSASNFFFCLKKFQSSAWQKWRSELLH